MAAAPELNPRAECLNQTFTESCFKPLQEDTWLPTYLPSAKMQIPSKQISALEVLPCSLKDVHLYVQLTETNPLM